MNDGRQVQEALRQALNKKSGSLDAATLARLHQAREAALAAIDRRSWMDRLMPDPWPRPAVGLAGLLVAIVGLTVWLQAPPATDPLGLVAEAADIAVDMAVADVDVELLEEIDFYGWLALMEDDGDSA